MRSVTPAPYLTCLGRSRLRACGLVALLLAAAASLSLPARAHAAASLLIRGAGDGHGIGMSQYGAEGYALHGAGYRAILAHYYQGTQLGQTSPSRVVRVLVADGAASFRGANRIGSLRLTPSHTYRVAAGVSALQITDTTTGRAVPVVTATVTVRGRGTLYAGPAAYHGSLVFSADGSGGVRTVDAVGLDDYVRGVLADEMPASWSPAALQAQAVAARTYAITATVNGRGYDLYDDARSQMYGGVAAETAAADGAVAATAGRVVTYGGQPVVTYFFASSGGHTESIQNVWPGASPEPWLQGVPDPYDGAAGDPYHSWSERLSLSAATAKLGRLVRGRLIGITGTRHGVSPRIISARVVGTRGTTTVTGAQLQAAFGLDSTDASFSTTG